MIQSGVENPRQTESRCDRAEPYTVRASSSGGFEPEPVIAAGLGGENITIGTVHTLQGAEKDVIRHCDISTYELDGLLGTKPRALYQRKKGRDLFDLAVALAQDVVDPDRVVEAFGAIWSG